MVPTDEEYLASARAALMTLIAELDTARERGDRAECRRRAADIRALVVRFREILGEAGGADDLEEVADAAKARVLRDLGTAAWDKPEIRETAPLSAAPAPGVLDRVNERELPPLTDEELAEIEAAARSGKTGEPRALDHVWFDDLLRLVAEVRRLRALEENGDLLATIGEEAIRRLKRLTSDEWLERAAEKITRGFDSEVGLYVTREEMVAILRKHRDGKA